MWDNWEKWWLVTACGNCELDDTIAITSTLIEPSKFVNLWCSQHQCHIVNQPLLGQCNMICTRFYKKSKNATLWIWTRTDWIWVYGFDFKMFSSTFNQCVCKCTGYTQLTMVHQTVTEIGQLLEAHVCMYTDTCTDMYTKGLPMCMDFDLLICWPHTCTGTVMPL